MNVIMFVAIGFGSVLLLAGGIFLYFKITSSKKFPFLLYSRDGWNVTTIHAKVLVNPENVKDKKFIFDEYDSPLDIGEPTKWINGVPHREITYNQLNEFSYVKGRVVEGKEIKGYNEFRYVKGTIIDDISYLKVALEPEEKQISLSRLKENMKRYENPMGKLQAYTLIAGFVLVLLLAIGIIYSTIAYVGASEDLVTLAKENAKAIPEVGRIADNIAKATSQLTTVEASISEQVNLTRRLT